MTSDLLSHAQSLQGDTVELRRRIHREPEVGLDLPRTRQAVLDALDGLPLDIHLHTKTSGIVAVLGHELPGPGFVLRGDMDGLPLSEDTGLEFASTGDTMHACGHDLHTAMLASAARLLCERRAQLPGPVVFMFQPGEEGYHGARYMLEEGLLDVVPRPSAGLAIHVTTSQAHGTFNHRSGPMLAAADELHVTITGEGGHASAPHQALDPIVVAAELVLAVQVAITRRVDVFDPAVVTFGSIQGGSTDNVIPETARLIGTIRTFSPETRTLVHDLVAGVAAGIAAAHGATAEVKIQPGFPVTKNDATVTDWITGLAGSVVGEEHVDGEAAPIMGAEDWSYVLQEIPGMMTFLGACPPGVDPESVPSNHSNVVVFDEDVMPWGVALYAAAALDPKGRATG